MKRTIIIGVTILSLLLLSACSQIPGKNILPVFVSPVNSRIPIGSAPQSDSTPTIKASSDWELGQVSLFTWTNSIGSEWIQASVPVKNISDHNLYLESGSFDYEDSTGHLVDTRTMVSGYPQVLAPGETGVYYESTTFTGAKSVASMVPHVKIKDAKIDLVRYDVLDVSLKEDMMGLTVTGRVQNNTSETGSMVYVVINLYDNGDNLVAQVMSILPDKLNPGDLVGFSASELGGRMDVASQIATYEAFAFPYEFQW